MKERENKCREREKGFLEREKRREIISGEKLRGIFAKLIFCLERGVYRFDLI